MEFKDLVSKVFTFDYIGALLASLLFPLVLVPIYAVPRAFLLHSYSLIGLLRKRARDAAPADSLHYGIETART